MWAWFSKLQGNINHLGFVRPSVWDMLGQLWWVTAKFVQSQTKVQSPTKVAL